MSMHHDGGKKGASKRRAEKEGQVTTRARGQF